MNNNNEKAEAIMFADWIKKNGYESDWFYSENDYLWYEKDSSDLTLTSTELYEVFLSNVEIE